MSVTNKLDYFLNFALLDKCKQLPQAKHMVFFVTQDLRWRTLRALAISTLLCFRQFRIKSMFMSCSDVLWRF